MESRIADNDTVGTVQDRLIQGVPQVVPTQEDVKIPLQRRRILKRMVQGNLCPSARRMPRGYVVYWRRIYPFIEWYIKIADSKKINTI